MVRCGSVVERRDDGGEKKWNRSGSGINASCRSKTSEGDSGVVAAPTCRLESERWQVKECAQGPSRSGNSKSHAPVLWPSFTSYDISYHTTILRVEVAVDVVLLVSKPIHRDPVAQSLHLFPHVRVSLLNPSLDLSLLLDIGSGVVPIAETVDMISTVQGRDHRVRTYM